MHLYLSQLVLSSAPLNTESDNFPVKIVNKLCRTYSWNVWMDKSSSHDN